MKNFIKFLIKAKKNTYASNSSIKKKLKDGGIELSFAENKFLYRDRYYGSKSFSGEEIVFVDKKPYWSMNYYGGFLKDEYSDDKNVYLFLKECLKKVNSNTIYRGPDFYEKNDFKYKNKFKGSVENFSGKEYIFYKNKKIYTLKYHGGIIK